MVWDKSFLENIGPQGKIEKILSFPESEHRVHEAPAYLPETNELLFSDTDIVGWLWLVNIDTREVRRKAFLSNMHHRPHLTNLQ